MHCESCNAEISSKMRGALKTNTCPFCGEKLMADIKAEQYLNLVSVLEQTTFTNRSEVDSQIRDKVASLLMGNFVFKKLDLPKVQPDIIVLNDEDSDPTKHMTVDPEDGGTIYKGQKIVPAQDTKVQKVSSTGKPLNTVTEEQALQRASSRSVSDAASRPKSTPQPSSGKGLSVRDYMNVQNETYTDDDSNSQTNLDLSDIDGLTPEEILTTFPELTVQDIQNIKNKALAKLDRQQQSLMPQKGLTGNGIKRL